MLEIAVVWLLLGFFIVFTFLLEDGEEIAPLLLASAMLSFIGPIALCFVALHLFREYKQRRQGKS